VLIGDDSVLVVLKFDLDKLRRCVAVRVSGAEGPEAAVLVVMC
jgi:hypothetical protein